MSRLVHAWTEGGGASPPLSHIFPPSPPRTTHTHVTPDRHKQTHTHTQYCMYTQTDTHSRGDGALLQSFRLSIPQKSRKSPSRSLKPFFPCATPPLFFYIQFTHWYIELRRRRKNLGNRPRLAFFSLAHVHIFFHILLRYANCNSFPFPFSFSSPSVCAPMTHPKSAHRTCHPLPRLAPSFGFRELSYTIVPHFLVPLH